MIKYSYMNSKGGFNMEMENQEKKMMSIVNEDGSVEKVEDSSI